MSFFRRKDSPGPVIPIGFEPSVTLVAAVTTPEGHHGIAMWVVPDKPSSIWDIPDPDLKAPPPGAIQIIFADQGHRDLVLDTLYCGPT